MGNILDYLDWRGDLSIKTSPFNAIDSLILCQLSYLDFGGIVSDSFKNQITLGEAAQLFKNSSDYQKRTEIGPLINTASFELLDNAGRSRRFGEMKVCGYVAQIDIASEKQFSAVTFILENKTIYIAFRGTDATIVGWKEDFNMAFMSPVPAQKDAIEYLQNAASNLSGEIRVGGHSKGGNLAIYAAAFCATRAQRRIFEVYNNDGPGFDKKTMEDKKFILISQRLHSFIPQSSIVGMLFEHEKGYTIVESSETNGILQHDPFSWHVIGNSFVTRPELTADSVFVDTTVKDWLQQMTREQRMLFIDTLFGVLQATKAKNLTELSENWGKNTSAILKALREIDPDTRDAVLGTIHMLFHSAKKNIPIVSELLPKKRWPFDKQ